MNFIQRGYKGFNDWWRYLLTLLLIFVFWQIIGVMPLLVAGFVKAENFNEFESASLDMFTSLGIDSNLYLFLVLFTLISALIGLLIGVRAIHKKTITDITTSRKKTDWNRIFFSFGLWFVISVTLITIGISLDSENLIWNFKPIPFLILVVISFLFIPLQTSFEELFMRGYLMQGFGILVKNRWFPLVITSIIFGLLHGANPEVDKLGYGIMVFYIGTGLMFGITTLMDEGTEIALGMHAANNIVAAIFVTADWTAFQTEALYIDTSEPSLGWDAFVPVFVLYPILLIIFSKKYDWKNWKEKLTGKIEEPTLIDS